MQTIQNSKTLTLVKSTLLAGLSIALIACGGGGSGTGTSNSTTPQVISSNGNDSTPRDTYLNQNDPTMPRSEDVNQFMIEFWDNVAANDRCGQCHDDSHETPFARTDNINDAYDATTPLINRAAPQQSALVTKVAGGHQCWVGSDSACAQILTAWITRWVHSADGTGADSTTIVLEKPDTFAIASTKVLPADPPSGFASGALRGLLQTYCSDCHAPTASTPQQPYFAGSSETGASEWESVRSKLDVQDESRSLADAQSRLVVRLRSEFHNCWDDDMDGAVDCNANALEMLTAIKELISEDIADPVDPTEQGLTISGGMILTEGTVASSGGRFEQHQIAYWNFSTGTGNVAYDISGIEPAMNLSLSGDISWVGGWGIDITSGRAWADTTSSKKIYDSVSLTGEYSVEAWVAPANVTQEEAHIITYANGSNERNFTVGQTLYNYDFYQKTNVDTDGDNNLSTDDDDELLQATLQHIVMTYSQDNGRRIYVNGELADATDQVTPGYLSNWSEGFVFSIGNEPTNNRQWQGMVRMAALHNRELSADQVLQNYDKGVGQKYYLLFDISSLAGITDCWDSYIVFEAAQLDNYAYRFNNPFFARLYEAQSTGDCTSSTAPEQANYSFELTDIRIGINSKVAEVGQAYRNIGRDPAGNADPITIDSASNADGYQQLSDIGTVLAIENGPVEDLFFLSFANINGTSGVITDPGATTVENRIAETESADYGLRTFDEVNASMSAMTGIPITHASISSVYSDVKTQLPTTEIAATFLASHQIAIAQMAITYCDALVNQEAGMSAGARTFFTSFDFTATPAVAFADATARDQIYDPLINLTVGTGLNGQPGNAAIKANFDTLLDGYSGAGEPRSGLLDCGTSCNAERTQTIVKSLCAASLGSGMMLIQ